MSPSIFETLSKSAQQHQLRELLGNDEVKLINFVIEGDSVICQVENYKKDTVRASLPLLSSAYPNHQFHIYQGSENSYLVRSNVVSGKVYSFSKLKKDRKRKQPDFTQMSCVYVGNYGDDSVEKVLNKFKY